MVFDISQKVALITGGASGIGLTIAKTLLRNGAKGVTLADINSKLGQNAVEDIEKEFGKNKSIFVETDVTDLSQLENAFKKTVENFQNIDMLFNNSGIIREKEYEKEVAVNVTGVIHGMLLGLENYLQKYRQGEESVIVNTSSIGGIDIYGGLPIYCGTKAAVIAMTRCWGVPQHYERTKVRCVAICPGTTTTPLLSNIRGITLGEFYERMQEEAVDVSFKQEPEFVADETMKIIRSGENGSIWVIEDNKPALQYTIPDRKECCK